MMEANLALAEVKIAEIRESGSEVKLEADVSNWEAILLSTQ